MNHPPNKPTGLRAWISDISPTCKHAVRLQSESRDKPLLWRQRLGLWIHLQLCRWCRRYGKQLGLIGKLAQRRDSEELALPPQTLRPETKARIKVALREHKK